jgi:hypothetical protein
MFCTLTLALPQYVCSVQYGCFCSSLISCFPEMLLSYILNDFEMVPVSHIINGITFAFTFHMRWVSIKRSLYICIRNFTASLLITFLSPEIAAYINIHVPFPSSRIMFCPVCCYEWFCPFAIVSSIIWLT